MGTTTAQWKPLTATHRFTTARPGFASAARIMMFPGVPVRVSCRQHPDHGAGGGNLALAEPALEQRHGHPGSTAVPGLTVATWSIHKAIGADRRRDLDRTAAVIGEVASDIIALQGADTRFGTRRGLLDLRALTGDHGLLEVPIPKSRNGPALGWHGNVLPVR